MDLQRICWMRNVCAVHIHCYGHALNLAVNDTIRQSPIMKYALDTVNEVSKLKEVS